MLPTERLYYSDSHLIEFDARVIDVGERVSNWTAVTLDRTAFYPTGGGQPSDTGTLDGARVVECVDEGDRVLHMIHGPTPAPGSVVRGRVDWPRRFDHLQQHTGQHILSQAFIKLFKAATTSFRVLEDSSEIDIDLKNPTLDGMERAIELANNVIWEDRHINIRMVSAEEAAELMLRKESDREGELRLIEIDGFDLTPCGGTHAHTTGEVGLIAARSWQRAKGLTRIEFVAGRRALEDYRRANKTANAVAALLSAGRDDAATLAERLLTENKELHHRVRSLEEVTTHFEAEELIASVKSESAGIAGHPEVKIVSRILEARDPESLTQALIAHPGTIALLASGDKETARLIFARSADSTGDMNALMRRACSIVDGRGGGKPDLAQGGGPAVERMAEAIETARRDLREQPSAVK